jgi:hypothetical protein
MRAMQQARVFMFFASKFPFRARSGATPVPLAGGRRVAGRSPQTRGCSGAQMRFRGTSCKCAPRDLHAARSVRAAIGGKCAPLRRESAGIWFAKLWVKGLRALPRRPIRPLPSVQRCRSARNPKYSTHREAIERRFEWLVKPHNPRRHSAAHWVPFPVQRRCIDEQQSQQR